MATTTSAVAHNAFCHQQLPDPRNHFRLLRVTKYAPQATVTPQQEHVDADLECELTTWLVANAPLYRAISYTWGDPKDTAWIRVNGKIMQVRQNCKDVLRQVHRHSGLNTYFWVDAICINQTDIDEKNIQVAMMGAIYQRAELVLACLGAHDEYSRALVQNLKQNSELFQQASTYYSVHKAERKPNRALEWRIRTWHVRQKPDQLIRMFFEFLCRPYFQRVWTWPEMRLASSVEILCGDDVVFASVLFGLSLLITRGLDQYEFDDETVDRVVENPFSVRYLPKAIRMGLIFLSAQKAVRQTPLIRLFPLWQAAHWLQRQGHEHLSQLHLDGAQGRLHHGHLLAMTMDNNLRDPLWDTLQFTLKLQCEKPRDRVYAILAIVDWSSGAAKPVQPDYNGDVYDLLKTLLPWLWSMNGPGPSNADTTFNQCRQMIDALQLDTQSSPKLAQGVDLRRRVNAEQTSLKTMIGSQPPDPVVEFSGFQVVDDKDGILRLDVPPHWTKKHEKNDLQRCFLLPPKDQWTATVDRERDRERVKALTQKASEQFYVVFDKHDRMCALLPHNAQSGDWIIADIEASATLVLREQVNGRFHIVGEAVVDLSFFHCLLEVSTKFLTTFDIDDFIVLCTCTRQITYLFQGRTEDSLVSLGNGVCYAPGSSYAVKHDN